jgi:predicted MFS family arabinose efflux permease
MQIGDYPMTSSTWRSPAVVLLCGGLILTLAMGLRHGFGLFLGPMTLAHGWNRETFAFAMALQNLVWGIAQPFTGMLADKFGAGKVLLVGALLYILGLLVMAFASNGTLFGWGSGVLIGLGLSGTTFSVVYGVIGRSFPAEKRSMALGIAGAAGSFGQFAMIPATQTLISSFGWMEALLIIAGVAVAMMPLSAAMIEKPEEASEHKHQSIAEAVREAFAHKGFLLLTLGYFVCGFQVVFIGVHFPSFLRDQGFTARDGVISLALIGLFNIFGTYAAGYLGGFMSKKYLLSGLYLTRSIIITGFLLIPISQFTIYTFAILMGLTWLATVPLTNGLVAQIFGVKHLSMLSGFVFFSHQVGSFLGVWAGGFLFDKTGSYNVVWMIAIGLGLMAMVANLPIDEREVSRLKPA